MSGAINAAGHLSALGGSVLSRGVRASMDGAASEFVEMSRLLAACEAEVARICEAEGACITAGAAAGIAIAVAACISRGEPALVAEIPFAGTARREVVVQAAHLINFGAPVAQMIALGGGSVRAAGSRETVTAADVEAALSPNSACFLWVQSHHTRDNASLPLQVCLRTARDAGVPFVMDCAAEEDLEAYTKLGADLVIYSGTKAVGAPVSGFIAGREPLAGWCRAQSRGIARAMKVGKEQIAGLMTALDEYVHADAAAEQARQQAILRALEDGLHGLAGADLGRLRDEAGRDIERLAVRLTPEAARALAQALQEGEPPVFTRPHRLSEGLVQFDPRCLRDADVPVIVGAVRAAWPAGAQ
jgi:D-glucosaminate-6-phosphate ammonia-lyase